MVNQIPANTPAQITGCVSDYSWCAVALPGGVTGWASAPYLVTSAAGTPKNLQVVGAQLGIPGVTPANTGAPVVATPPVGAMRVENGKITYQGDYYDSLGFQKQLGWIQ